MIELFHNHASTCSQKVRICFAEKALEFVDCHIDLGKFEHLTPEFLAINPNGVVPAIRHDGVPLIESTVICEYLDEIFPSTPLSPPNAQGRAQMRAWLRYLDEVPSMAIRVPTFQNLILPSYQNLSKADFEQLADSMPLRKIFIMRMGQDGFESKEYQASIEQLDRSIKRMEKALEFGPYLLGEQYTIADICAVPILHRMEELGMAAMWRADAPCVADWYRRVTARRSFAKAFYPAAKLASIFPNLRAIEEEACQ